ncbi:MAG TPA: acyloxyacyl hydrolase [Bacteroidales bacterium]|jgi:hypothetical protein|nr:acyloxyacyl hydrolase [Bacteroidales bacterium]HRS18392.1 acyloxyacyl hydrolase [Bacteroidales bacterium]
MKKHLFLPSYLHYILYIILKQYLYILLIITCFTYNKTFGQITNEIQTKLIGGTVLPHHSSIAFLLAEYQKGFEIQYNQKNKHITQFDTLYNFPSFGIAYQHISLGNSLLLGYASQCYATMRISLFSHTKHTISFEQDLGISYIHSSLLKSPYNTALSSPINFYAGIDFQYTYSITNQHSIISSVELSHISNGKIKTPNLGINSITFGLAYAYSAINNNAYSTKQILWHTHSIYTGLHGFYKSDDFLSTTKYPVISALFEYEYRHTPKYGILLGFDGFYDQSHFALSPLPESTKLKLQSSEYGIHTGLSAHYNNMSIYIATGKYIRTVGKKPPYYSRVGIRYAFNHFLINLSIKSHRTTADFLECGVGIFLFRSHH